MRAADLRVRKAIFPVAGMGTRFLPATKAIPKEMLPIVDRPLIQYAVDEAIAAGIEELIFVTHRSKRAIEDHFDRAPELEQQLERSGKSAPLDEVRHLVPERVRISYARQSAPLGLGHAVWSARHLVGHEPFAVILPDDLIDAQPAVLGQMMKAYAKSGASQIAVQIVARDEVSSYGIVQPAVAPHGLTRISSIVEKPRPADAPSTLAVVGRYLFSPRMMSCLQDLEPGAGNEIQLTDGIARLLAQEDVFAFRYSGRRYDCGSKLGFLEATVAYALKDPSLAADFQYIINRSASIEPRRPRHLRLVGAPASIAQRNGANAVTSFTS